MSLPVFITLLILSGLGLLMGALYYIRPERIVNRRIKRHHWETAKKDAEFMNWLNVEIETQVKRTKRMGMIIVVLEAIWMVLILSVWLKGLGR